MSLSKLVSYLSELPNCWMRVQFAREILAKNMNFSPAWILSLLHNDDEESTQELDIHHFGILIKIVGLEIDAKEFETIYRFFCQKGKDKIRNKDFIELLLPFTNVALKNAVLKRLEEDLELSSELKYGLKRLLQQILEMELKVKYYSEYFTIAGVTKQCYDCIQKQQLKQFLSKYGKYPSDDQLDVLVKLINQGRIKTIDATLIKQAIIKSQKQLKDILNQSPIQTIKRQSPSKNHIPTNPKHSPVLLSQNNKAQSPLKILKVKSIIDSFDDQIFQTSQVSAFSPRRNLIQSPKIQKNQILQKYTTPTRYQSNTRQRSRPYNHYYTPGNFSIPESPLKRNESKLSESYCTVGDIELLKKQNKDREREFEKQKLRNSTRISQIRAQLLSLSKR